VAYNAIADNMALS